jgi:hypothetical protein
MLRRTSVAETVLESLDLLGELCLAGPCALDDRRRRLRDERVVGEPGTSGGEVALGLGELLLETGSVGHGRR